MTNLIRYVLDWLRFMARPGMTRVEAIQIKHGIGRDGVQANEAGRMNETREQFKDMVTGADNWIKPHVDSDGVMHCDGYWIGYTYYIINPPELILPDGVQAVNDE